ncbi:MAG: PQQ-binding-like beta-propeller repeat protein [Bacteroidota bacterium]
MISRTSIVGGRSSAVWLLLVALFWVGCEVLQVGRPLALDEGAWTTEGGSAARTFEAEGELALPLEEKWVYNAEGAFGPAAALVAEGQLFVATRQGEVRSLDLAEERTFTGQTDLGDAIDGAPVLTDRLLIAPISAGGDGVVAYDIVRGRIAWKLDAEPHAAGLLRVGDTLVAASLLGTIRALDVRTGAVQWELASDSVQAEHASPVLLDAATVAVVDDQGRISAHSLTDGSPRWTADLEVPVYATPAVADGLLLVPTTRGQFVALDAATGQRRWTYAAATPTTRLTSPATDRRTLFVGTSDGTIAALDVQTGDVRWTHTEDGVIAAAPHLAGDVLFVGSLRKRVFALDAATGTVRWQTEIGGRVKTAPLVAGGYLVVMAEPRQVYLFGPPVSDAIVDASAVDSLAAR